MNEKQSPTENPQVIPHAGEVSATKPAGMQYARDRHIMRLHIEANQGRRDHHISSGLRAVFAQDDGGAK